jgi:hypothetical protein
VVGFTTGSRGEVPRKKENLRKEMMMIIIMSLIHWSASGDTDVMQTTALIRYKFLSPIPSNIVVEWLQLLLRIWEFPNSNLGPETSYLE